MSNSKEEKLLDKAANKIMREKVEGFAQIIQRYKNFHFPKKGEIIEAKVVQTNKEGVLLDVGAKTEGFMPWEEFNGKDKKTLQPGEVIQVYVLPRSEGGHLLLSEKEADFHLDWAKFEEAFKQGKPIVVKIEKMMKGGFLARLNSLNAFLPASHISLRKRDNLKKFVGKRLTVRVIELNKNLKNIVLSRKLFLLEEKEKRKEKTLASLKEGQIVTGKVNSITKFGVFVDLGGIDGLIYPENLSWGWVKDPQRLLSKGDKIKVKILKLEKEKGKISLGLKQTKPDPWEEVEKRHEVGSIVSGKVTHLTNFGAFVEIEEGLEGLIHISDFSWNKRIEHPAQTLKKEEKVEVKILDIDATKI